MQMPFLPQVGCESDFCNQKNMAQLHAAPAPVVVQAEVHWPRTYMVSWPLIDTAYLLGVIPIRWNRKTNKYKMTTSKWALCRWRVTVLLTLAVDISILYGVYLHAKRLGYDLHAERMVLGFQYANVAFISNSMIMHINTFFNMGDIQSFLNSWLRFYEQSQSKANARNAHAPAYAKYDAFCANIMALFYMQFHGTCWLNTAVFVYGRCDIHFLATVLPICDGRSHNSYLMVPVWAMVQFSIGVLLVNGCMMYLHFLPIFVSQGLVVAAELKSILREDARGHGQHQRQAFYDTYRCVRMLVAHFNQCISFVAPAHIWYLVGICSLTLYVMITGSYGWMVLIGMVTFLLTMMVYITYAGGSLSQIKKSTKMVLHQAKDQYTGPYMKRVARSCPPLKIWIGRFGTMPDDFVVEWAIATIDLTMSMLLM